MLYNIFTLICELMPNKMAVNGLTYSSLRSLVETSPYIYVTKERNEKVLFDILTAAYHNKPLIIPPKDGIDFELPQDLPDCFGIYLYTSGSTAGKRKPIFLSESMLINNARVANDCQGIISDDIVYNVCSMNHTGGLNVQVIPGLLVGATIIIEDFEPFTFNKRLNETGATLTHLVPKMMNALRKVDKNNLRLVAAGSDCVSRENVKFWLDKDVPFMLNYGMTEAGPVIINHIFKSQDELTVFDKGVPLGDQIHSGFILQDSELSLSGKSIHREGWLLTGDCVEYKDGWFFYNGRKSAGCKIIPKRY